MQNNSVKVHHTFVDVILPRRRETLEFSILWTTNTSRKIRNILQIEQDGVKAIKYKTALIPILRYILAAIVTCDQAIFFFLARGNFPPSKKKKITWLQVTAIAAMDWLPIKFPIINSGINVHGDRTYRSRIMSAFA